MLAALVNNYNPIVQEGDTLDENVGTVEAHSLNGRVCSDDLCQKIESRANEMFIEARATQMYQERMKRTANLSEEEREKRRAYQREWSRKNRQTDEHRAKARERYHSRYKEKVKAYNQRPDVKAKRREYMREFYRKRREEELRKEE